MTSQGGSRLDAPSSRALRALGRAGLIAVVIGFAWILLVWVPIVRIAWSFATGSGSTPLDVLLPADPAFDVEARISGQTLIGGGATSLADGSVVTVWVLNFGDGPSCFAGPVEVIVDGGRFETVFDLRTWPSGEVRIKADFDIADPRQPAAIVARYGGDGVGMTGPMVTYDEDEARWFVGDYETIDYRNLGEPRGRRSSQPSESSSDSSSPCLEL